MKEEFEELFLSFRPLSNQRLLFDGHLQKLSLPVQPPGGEMYLNAKVGTLSLVV